MKIASLHFQLAKCGDESARRRQKRLASLFVIDPCGVAAWEEIKQDARVRADEIRVLRGDCDPGLKPRVMGAVGAKGSLRPGKAVLD